MKQTRIRRPANIKTFTETGFSYVRGDHNILTPFGMKAMKEAQPFFPGEEDELREELSKVEMMTAFAENNAKSITLLGDVFMVTKDITNTVKRSREDILSTVEIFEIKSALLNSLKIREIIASSDGTLADEFIPEPIDDLLDLLDPRKDRMNTFYIYDDYSGKLADLRKEKRKLEREIRKIQKARQKKLADEYGILLTPKFDIVIPKSSDDLEIARTIPDLEAVHEDYVSVTFELTKNRDTYTLLKEVEDVNQALEEEESLVRETLTRAIADKSEAILRNFASIGRLDFVLAKAMYAIKHNFVMPEICEEHIIEIEDGRHPVVEKVLAEKGKEYCPISLKLMPGVTCITGANMGGKTISLKLAGLVPLLAQYGYFVPCKRARVGLSNFMQILIGDTQSVERGLSSFGSEMEELKEILDRAKDRSLILIDEIASGTNPVEGLALSKSLVDYLLEKPYISVITTHFETVTEKPEVKNLQVRGLKDADFAKLDRELRLANRKERIQIISKYMDYRLTPVDNGKEIPKDAINIAKILGINKEIIEGAKKYIG